MVALFWGLGFDSSGAPPFVTVKKGKFMVGDQPYRYVGVNYWYGGLIGNNPAGKKRIEQELNFLVSMGVSNLRVLAGAEGAGQINGVPRVEPAFQPKQGVFNEDLLQGLDFLLAEMNKRQMKAVLFISNNWEWSGGFLQYLNWNGLIPDSILRRKLSWDEMRDYVSQFYACLPCMQQYEAQLRKLVNRVNPLTGIKYSEDPAIMSWEIANEPRPMRPHAINAYRHFIHHTASLLKQLDKNHLVTTGSEGEMGSETMENFQKVHEDPAIDYLTIHIWPKNWSWFRDTAIAAGFDNVLLKTGDYIRRHQEVAKAIGKPLVIEEFGLPRDGHAFDPGSTTAFRDRYYSFVFDFLLKDMVEKGSVSGVNFWAFSGIGRASHKQLLWSKGDDWLGDPPVEEQGLNSVFDTDKSTWDIVYSCTSRLTK